MGGVVLGGKIYIVGGQTGYDHSANHVGLVHAYDLTTNTWTQVASLPGARSHITNSTFVLNGQIIVAGGENANRTSSSAVTAYDPATNTCRTLTSLPAPRQ